MSSATTPIAVLYCRVSSQKQVKNGHGLDSQEHRCREFTAYKGYEVGEVFRDEGVSGGMIDRPGMKAMLGWLRKRRGEALRVIFDDISRLARDFEAHKQLRAAIGSVGAVLESPSVEFGEDADGILVENLLASVSQHQREKNAEQVKNRMRARMSAGYWTFAPPAGYRFDTVRGHGRMLVRDEPVASLLQESFEGLASGRFQDISDVKRFLDAKPDFPKGKTGEVARQSLHYILPRRIYAGYLDLPKWKLDMVEAKHEPLVSLETWRKAMDRLEAKSHAPERKDLHLDFLLRGAVLCACCGNKLTAAWSKGRGKLYPYYLCQTRGCDEKGKSIRKDEIEREFETILRRLRPNQQIIRVMGVVLKNLWDQRIAGTKTERAEYDRRIRKAETEIDGYLDRLAASTDQTLADIYEGKIRKLAEEKALLAEKRNALRRPKGEFEALYRTALDFLLNPWRLWTSGRFEDQRTLLKLVLDAPLTYCRNEGYRTAEMAFPFKVLNSVAGGEGGVVEGAGFEPA